MIICSSKQKTKQGGFTLIEMSVVVLILAIMWVGALRVYSLWYESYKVRLTENRLDRIEELLRIYVQEVGRLPCPSSLEDNMHLAGYGTEDCAGATGSGIEEIDGRDPPGPDPALKIRIGAIPIATIRSDLADAGTLNGSISDDLTIDGWRNKFTYAVTKVMTDPMGYVANDGAVSVIDTAGNSLTAQAPETASYTVISHGFDERGAYTTGSTEARPCNIAAVDGENCDYKTGGSSKDFLFTLLRSSTGDNNNSDDFVIYTTKDLTGGLKVADFSLEILPCDESPSSPSPGSQGPVFGQNCNTKKFRYNDSRFTPPQNALPANTITRIYDSSFVGAIDDARIFIRATIPARFYNYGWKPPLLAAIYIDNNLIGRGEILNPARQGGNSNGGTGVVLATNQNTDPNLNSVTINKGQSYDVSIYTYTDSCTGGCPNQELSVGTVRFDDHYVDGSVEIMQTEQ